MTVKKRTNGPENQVPMALPTMSTPPKAAWTIFRKVALLLYAMTRATPSAMIAVMTSPIGLAVKARLSSRQARAAIRVAADQARMARRAARMAMVMAMVDRPPARTMAVWTVWM